MTLKRHRCQPGHSRAGFSPPPSTACLSTIDAPMLHRLLNLCQRMGTTTTVPPAR